MWSGSTTDSLKVRSSEKLWSSKVETQFGTHKMTPNRVRLKYNTFPEEL